MNTIDQAYQVREKLAQLEEGLNTQAPGITTLLQEIHRTLKKDPDVVTILTEEECSVLVSGLKKQTSTEIATAALKGPKKKALKSMSLTDL